MSYRAAKTVVLVAGASLASLAIGVAIGRRTRDERATPALRIRVGMPPSLVNPLLDCEDAQSIVRADLANFKELIQARIDERRKAGAIVEAGYYFRQLNDGIWIGIREREKILPASILKIPLAIAILLKVEHDPAILDRKVVFRGSREGEPVQMFPFPDALVVGKAYTVRDLLGRMLRLSDNNAVGLLQEIVPDEEFNSALSRLNVYGSAAEGYQADLKVMSSFFRTLYNGTFLSHDRSEELLEMMTDPWFRWGIVGGVPKEVVTATKYGDTIKRIDGTEYFQFHELGIVYHPEQPYLVGVYAVGADMDKLVGFVREVSAITFEQVDTQTRGIPAAK